MRYEREYYYSCDLTPRGGKRRQLKLSAFMKRTEDNHIFEDNHTVKTTATEDNPCPDYVDTEGVEGTFLSFKSEKNDEL